MNFFALLPFVSLTNITYSNLTRKPRPLAIVRSTYLRLHCLGPELHRGVLCAKYREAFQNRKVSSQGYNCYTALGAGGARS